MKPIIVDMEELTESMKIYNSKPRSFIIGFIYIVMGMMIAFTVWMYYREIDIVVKAKGTFHSDDKTEEIYTNVSGKIVECNIENGMYVSQGDVLFATETNDLIESMGLCKRYLSEIEAQLEILNEYRQGIENTAKDEQNDVLTESEERNLITEKYNIGLQIAKFEEKKFECENQIQKLQKEYEDSIVKAKFSGYISVDEEIREGMYVQKGVNVCRIIRDNSIKNDNTENNHMQNSSRKEKENIFYADIYVDSRDIVKLKDNQKVRFEIAAYPANEYGYFTGYIESISKDAKYDDDKAYYQVKVACDAENITDRYGNKIEIMNGMECTANIVIGKKSVMKYLIENLL